MFLSPILIRIIAALVIVVAFRVLLYLLKPRPAPLGFRTLEGQDFSVAQEKLVDLPYFEVGEIKEIYEGQLGNGKRAWVLEICQIETSGDYRYRRYLSAIVVRLKNELPTCRISRRNASPELIHPDNYQEIVIGNPKFNTQIEVTGRNDDRVRSIISPEVQAFLLKEPAPSYGIKENRLVCLWSGRLTRKQVEERIHCASWLLHALSRARSEKLENA
ncbi:MAG: hypothetical protein BGO01_08865 [Armatimonadetes bacterium 55-13]|nr:hypothetical protein [Armatimonadota bacterium]OJU61972.1 MAG: hypothetical protein BGO01_08865 [Armatimonadetes bacterium 55-13]